MLVFSKENKKTNTPECIGLANVCDVKATGRMISVLTITYFPGGNATPQLHVNYKRVKLDCQWLIYNARVAHK